MRVLVTGGTGFLGRHVVWRLIKNGVDVHFTGRNINEANVVVALSEGKPSFTIVDHGTSDALDKLRKISKNMDAVVHCAALSSPWGKYDDFYRANVVSTSEIIDICCINKIKKLVHISSPSIYCSPNDRISILEDSVLPKPINEYASTKSIAEKLLILNESQETIILRPRALFGPWDTTLLPRLLKLIASGKSIPLARNGSALLDLTYVENAVDAILLSITASQKERVCIYNVSNGEPVAFDDLLTKISENFLVAIKKQKVPYRLLHSAAFFLEQIGKIRTGHEPLLTRYGVVAISFSQTLSINKIQRELGYSPKISIDEGIALHASWHLNQENGYAK